MARAALLPVTAARMVPVLLSRKLAHGVYHCFKPSSRPPLDIGSDRQFKPGIEVTLWRLNGNAAPDTSGASALPSKLLIDSASRLTPRRPTLISLKMPPALGVYARSARTSFELPLSSP